MDGAQRHLRDHRLVELVDLPLRARDAVDDVPGENVLVVPVGRDHRLRWQLPLNDDFLLTWPVHGAGPVREPVRVDGQVKDEGAELRDRFRVLGPAVPHELVDAGIVLGDGGGERGRGRLIGGALLGELPAPAVLRGRVPLTGLGVGGASAVELLLKAGPGGAAEEPASF